MQRIAGSAATLLAALALCRSLEAEVIPLRSEGGAFVVAVLINHKIIRNFTIDSGSADVSIPADLYGELVGAGTVAQADMLDTRRYRLADGSEQRSPRFLIRSMRVGSIELHDVVASVVPEGGELLLGQSFLSRLRSWSIDNDHHVLVLNESPGAAASTPRVAATASAATDETLAPLTPVTPVMMASSDRAFVEALALLLTGDDRGDIRVVDRAECVVEVPERGPAAPGARSAHPLTVHFNNVDRGRSEIRLSATVPPKVEVTLRGVGVTGPAQDSRSEAARTLVLDTSEYARVQGAWNYIYSHGCRGLNWSPGNRASTPPPPR